MTETKAILRQNEGLTQLALRVYGSWNPQWKWIARRNGLPSDDGQLTRWTGPMLRPGMELICPASDPGTTPNTPGKPTATTTAAVTGNTNDSKGNGGLLLVACAVVLGGMFFLKGKGDRA